MNELSLLIHLTSAFGAALAEVPVAALVALASISASRGAATAAATVPAAPDEKPGRTPPDLSVACRILNSQSQSVE